MSTLAIIALVVLGIFCLIGCIVGIYLNRWHKNNTNNGDLFG